MTASDSLRNSIPMGLLCAPVGALTGVYIASTAIGHGYGVFIIAAPVAAFLSGTFSWWLVMARPGRHGPLPAALAGALAAVIGHFLCWYLLLVALYVWHAVTGALGSPRDAPINPLLALSASGVYGAFSLLFFGWVTVPTGALLGVLLCTVQRRTHSNIT